MGAPAIAVRRVLSGASALVLLGLLVVEFGSPMVAVLGQSPWHRSIEAMTGVCIRDRGNEGICFLPLRSPLCGAPGLAARSWGVDVLPRRDSLNRELA